MPVPSKPYTFANGPSNLIDAPQVNANFDALYSALNAGLDDTNLASALKAKLGVSDTSGTVRRGAFSVAGQNTRTNAAYGTMSTPDQIDNVVLPTDGLIVLAYQATWQESVAGAARAAIFLGPNQLKVNTSTSGAAVQQARTPAGVGSLANVDTTLFSSPIGLLSGYANAGGSDATTGQAVGALITAAQIGGEVGGQDLTSSVSLSGGPCYIFAAAGTYTVSVQFKASSGNVVVKNRHLWVWTLGF